MAKKASLIIVFVLALATLLSACGGNKTAKTPEEFTSFMEDKNFRVDDVTASTNTDDLANKVLVAYNGNYQIEFYELIDDATGNGVFNNNKDIFEDKHSVKTMSTEITTSNYSYYHFTGEDNFYMISRIKNTMLYCVAHKDFKDEIVDIVKNLGY